MPAGSLNRERDSYTRGRLESRFVSAAPPVDAKEDADLAALLRRYYDYRVWRLVRGYILSSNNDRRSLHKLVETVVRVGLTILLAKTKEEAEHVKRILVTTDFSCRRIENQPPQIEPDTLVEPSGTGFALGQTAIGRDVALGSNPAESVWTLTIDVELRMSQATALKQRPDVVDSVMKALERSIPLNLDYVLRFHVEDNDYTMLLSRVEEKRRKAGAFPPVVGLNSALGKVKD